MEFFDARVRPPARALALLPAICLCRGVSQRALSLRLPASCALRALCRTRPQCGCYARVRTASPCHQRRWRAFAAAWPTARVPAQHRAACNTSSGGECDHVRTNLGTYHLVAQSSLGGGSVSPRDKLQFLARGSMSTHLHIWYPCPHQFTRLELIRAAKFAVASPMLHGLTRNGECTFRASRRRLRLPL